MAKVRATIRAAHLGTNPRSQGSVFDEFDRVLAGGGVKGGPATTRMEFSLRFKEFIAAGLATIGANGLGIGVFASKGALGSGIAQNIVGERVEFGSELYLIDADGILLGIRQILHRDIMHGCQKSGAVTN